MSTQLKLELVLTTDKGVLGDDNGTFDIALEIGEKIKQLQVISCQASSDEDKKKFFDYIVDTLGSLDSMDRQIRRSMGQMLKQSLKNVGLATGGLLHRLRQK